MRKTTFLGFLAISGLLGACSGSSEAPRHTLSFDEARTYSFASGTSGMRVVDMDGDHTLDVVGFDYSSHTVEVKLGRGDGSLRPSVSVDSAVYFLADIDADGKLDLFGTDASSQLVTSFGNGDGTFHAGASTQVPGGRFYDYAADVDGDGYVELVSLENEVYAATMYASGQIVSQKKLFDAPQGAIFQLVVDDLNGDGRADFVFTTQGGLEVTLSAVDGSYATTSVDLGPFDTVNMPWVGDVNGDGKRDIAFLGSESGRKEESIVVLVNDGAGGFQKLARTDLGLQVGGYDFVDIDHDGKIDTSFMVEGVNFFALGKGDGTFGELLAFDAVTKGSMRFADMNNDGKIDLVIQSASDVSILVAK